MLILVMYPASEIAIAMVFGKFSISRSRGLKEGLMSCLCELTMNEVESVRRQMWKSENEL